MKSFGKIKISKKNFVKILFFSNLSFIYDFDHDFEQIYVKLIDKVNITSYNDSFSFNILKEKFLDFLNNYDFYKSFYKKQINLTKSLNFKHVDFKASLKLKARGKKEFFIKKEFLFDEFLCFIFLMLNKNQFLLEDKDLKNLFQTLSNMGYFKCKDQQLDINVFLKNEKTREIIQLFFILIFLYKNELNFDYDKQNLFFLNKDKKIEIIFENFLLNFYKYYLSSNEYDIYKKYINWNVKNIIGNSSLLPKMKSDIFIFNKVKNKSIILDAKFYNTPLMTHFDKQKTRSSHIYQIFAYVMQAKAYGGIVIYPKVDKDFDLQMIFDDFFLRFVSIDFLKPFSYIKKKLLSFIHFK